jgi:hypothetical protein
MNNITTIMHKETITQDIRGSPQRGATSTNSSSSLLSSVNHLHAQSHQNPTPHRTGDLCAPRQILLP